MKKLKFISVPILIAFMYACNVLNSSDHQQNFEYRFETKQTVYTSTDTVRATFANQSDKKLYLNFQVCTLVGIQKLENRSWNSIPIPILCTLEVKGPIPVDSGKETEIGIALRVFEKDNLEEGIYRLDVKVSQTRGNQQREFTSNNFKIMR